jgi:hypothetical protein
MAGIAMPGILSQYSDRLGNVYGPDTLEANWYEDRLQRAAGVLKAPEGAATVLRSHEPDLSAQQKEITGSLAICPRTSRHPFMYQSRCVLSDGRNEKTSMSDTYFKPLAERPANPICSGGVESPYDAMLQQLTQHDSPKTRVSKDRMSNVQNEVRPVVDSEDKIKQRFITPRTLAHLYAERPSSQSGCRGFGAVVPRHEVGYAERLFSTTTRDALSTGLLPPATLSVRATQRAGRAPPSAHCSIPTPLVVALNWSRLPPRASLRCAAPPESAVEQHGRPQLHDAWRLRKGHDKPHSLHFWVCKGGERHAPGHRTARELWQDELDQEFPDRRQRKRLSVELLVGDNHVTLGLFKNESRFVACKPGLQARVCRCLEDCHHASDVGVNDVRSYKMLPLPLQGSTVC